MAHRGGQEVSCTRCAAQTPVCVAVRPACPPCNSRPSPNTSHVTTWCPHFIHDGPRLPQLVYQQPQLLCTHRHRHPATVLLLPSLRCPHARRPQLPLQARVRLGGRVAAACQGAHHLPSHQLRVTHPRRRGKQGCAQGGVALGVWARHRVGVLWCHSSGGSAGASSDTANTGVSACGRAAPLGRPSWRSSLASCVSSTLCLPGRNQSQPPLVRQPLRCCSSPLPLLTCAGQYEVQRRHRRLDVQLAHPTTHTFTLWC